MLRRAGLLAALTALLVPAVAGTSANAKTRAPVVRSITPKNVFVGQTLTIRGHHFRRGLNKNTVAFKRSGARVMFVKAEKGTTKMLKVTLPKRLEKLLYVKNGTPTPTRLRVRVLSKTFGKRFTSRSNSPIVGAEKPPAPPKPQTVDPNADCDGDGTPNRLDSDDDNDLLPDTQEKAISSLLDTCKADTDGDGIDDGYEYQSAKDLNEDEDQDPNAYVPYPAKKPYPNPLDKTDANTDHDGDSLTLAQEYRLWNYSTAHGEPRTLSRLSYSAGEQYSKSTFGGNGRRTPTLLADGYAKQASFLNWATSHHYLNVSLASVGTTLFTAQTEWYAPRDPVADKYDIRDADRDHSVSLAERLYYNDSNAYLDDAERDEDADGLSNFDETRGCMNRNLWDVLYSDETPYTLAYSGTDVVDPDTDGDGILDGADDQDHDDIPNIMECSRYLATGGLADPRTATAARPEASLPAAGWVNPFNPCLPHFLSRTCPRWRDVNATPYAPFDAKKRADGKYYFIWN
jgi:hypothetical protein